MFKSNNSTPAATLFEDVPATDLKGFTRCAPAIDYTQALESWKFKTQAHARLREVLQDPAFQDAVAIALCGMHPTGDVTDPIVVTAKSHQLAGANTFLTKLSQLSSRPATPTSVALAGQEWAADQDPS